MTITDKTTENVVEVPDVVEGDDHEENDEGDEEVTPEAAGGGGKSTRLSLWRP